MSATSPVDQFDGASTPSQGAVWAFDVDGTLIGSIRSDVLRPGTTDLLDALGRAGQRCVLWSAGGADYAQRMAARHGIEHQFLAFYAKDTRDTDGKYVIDHFDSAHRPHVFVDDSTIDLHDDHRTIAVPQFIGGNRSDTGLIDLLRSLDDIMGTIHTTGAQ